MSVEDMKAALAVLLEEIADRPEDAAILEEELRARIAELKALGLDVPDNLDALENWLDDELGPEPDNMPV